MKARPAPGALAFLPARHTLPALRRAADSCRGCPLWKDAHQTVFGEGPRDAQLVMVGEQPGDVEDKQGHVFVGPAGRLLNEILEEVGIDRSAIYLTNAVKHFKFEPRGKRRLHKKPNQSEIWACKPWLECELKAIKPRVLVCLGATAALALFGSTFKVTEHRGQRIDSALAPYVLATVHPSALLRAPTPEARVLERKRFAADLLLARKLLEGAAPRHQAQGVHA